MKYGIVVKFLAFALAAVSLVAAVGCGAGIVLLESAGLYINDLSELQDQAYESIAREIAKEYAEFYAGETYGNLPYALKSSFYADPTNRSDTDHWYVQLWQDGVILADEGHSAKSSAYSKEYTIDPIYAIASAKSPEDMVPATTAPENTEAAYESTQMETRSSVYPDIIVPDGYLYYSQESAWQNGRLVTYYVYYYQAPEYTVKVYLQEGVLESSSLHLLTTIFPYRHTFIWLLAACLLMAAVCLVYLICAAGRCGDGSIRPGGLNRVPLDLYALLSGGGIFVLTWLMFNLLEWVENEGPHWGNLSMLALNLLGIILAAMAFVFAFSAQVKVKNAFWWRHSIIGWCCGKLAAAFRLLGRSISALRRMLPLMWQWLITAGVMALSVVITFLLAANSDFFILLFLLSLLGCAGVVIYGGYCFGTLMKGARRMSEGDLSCKISTRYLRGSFLDFANQLNSLSEAAMISAKKQMQSERMKSELITNVSHDIKTPLTSIINFVDLLQKPHSQQQEQEYLEVLFRQSAQMKKLIDDLMELSRASSGNITVNLQQVDAAEVVNQSLGEFSDKLEAAGLTPIFLPPQEPVYITADGRLMWRVLSNLLINAIKYALPGTRLYVDLLRVEDKVLLSLKNISREPLNVSAEELLERFVRGDVSRNSEGSGLGLNIAMNLMEVQGGKLQLLLDGDLFKVTLLFPSADV